MTGSAQIIRGDALALPLADSSVDLVVTSPPYFALRSYQDGGEHYAGQLGSEATPAEFVDALIAATREMVRVLKPSGSIWVNLGDKYAGSAPGRRDGGENGLQSLDRKHGRAANSEYTDRGGTPQGWSADWGGSRPKSLIGIPWRYAIRCIDDLGLILRAEVIWSKPNGLPESVQDRVRRSHEQWFHMVKQPRYFSAVDEIREPHAPWTLKAYAYEQANDYKRKKNADRVDAGNAKDYAVANPLGKLPGSVWTIPTEPLTVPDHLGIDHFAAFPTEWPRRIVQGWSPAGVCVECGEGRRPVSVDVGGNRGVRGYIPSDDRHKGQTQRSGPGSGALTQPKAITGYACACPEPTADTSPAVVLDPFGGTGTTALVAKALGRHGISVDMSADYCRLAEWRTTDPNQLAKAARVEKPPKQIDGQLGFDLEIA